MLEPEPGLGAIQWLMCVNYAFFVEKGTASDNVHGVIWFLWVEDSGIWLKIGLLVSHGPAAAAIIKRNKQATKQLSRKQFWKSVLINVLNLITTDQTIMSVAFARTETPISDSLVVLSEERNEPKERNALTRHQNDFLYLLIAFEFWGSINKIIILKALNFKQSHENCTLHSI